MKPIYGEFECKIDSKGRFVLPSGIKKQLPENGQKDFVINRGLDTCLVMYPESVWEKELTLIHSRNQYITQNRAFARMFMNGATPVELDASGRALIPKRLADYAGIKKDLVLVAQFDRIEIWDKQVYEQWLASDRYDIEKLSEEVMKDAGSTPGDAIS